jgi:hypothetical protein
VSANPKSPATLDSASFLFAHSAPYASILTGIERPPQALVGDGTAPANRLSLLHLQNCRARRTDREEQFRILVAANSTVTPVHGGNNSLIGFDQWQ